MPGALVVQYLLTTLIINRSPPARSVIFFFSDLEEGEKGDNVGIPDDATRLKAQRYKGKVPGLDSFLPLPFPGFPVTSKMPCPSRTYFGQGATPSWFKWCGEDGLVGMTAWTNDPTIDLAKIKVAVAVDPLGTPGVKVYNRFLLNCQ